MESTQNIERRLSDAATVLTCCSAERDGVSAGETEALPQPGIGTDVVEIARLERAVDRWGERLLTRVFTDSEIAYCRGKREPLRHFAGRLAAKEAVYKALGLRWSGPFSWRMIEIGRSESGAPEVLLHNGAGEGTEGKNLAVSISHEGEVAVAVAAAFHVRPGQ
ncbi:MAG: holo-ACP synthase [Bacteroidota bacterium]